MIQRAGPGTRLLEGEGPRGLAEIESLQVTAKSFLGACAFHIGGLLIDHGWLQILGCGHAACSWSISAATRHVGWGTKSGPPEALIIAVDVLGGLYAINGGAITDIEPGHVAYLAPDTLQWEHQAESHSEWLTFFLDPEHRAAIYQDQRWKGWEQEVQRLPPDTGIGIYPPLFTMESRPIESTTRAPIPLSQLVTATLDLARQMG